MKKAVLIVGAIVALGLLFGFVVNDKFSQTSAQNAQQAEIVKLDTNSILSMVNDQRSLVGTQPLTIDERLTATAQLRADDMVARNYYSHFDPVDGHAMIMDLDVEGCVIGENLVIADNEVSAIVQWMQSESHRNAMLDKSTILTGIAINEKIIVQHFCVVK